MDVRKIGGGGSFAPPLTDELLTKYKHLFYALPAGRVKDACDKLVACCEAWWALPESSLGGTPHPSGRALAVPLEDDHKKKLYDLIPWSRRSNGRGEPDELEAIGDVLETISNETQKELRDAAHHLLWHVHELDLDREPITRDKLLP